MEKYQMNRSGCRPYNHTCGMMPKPSVKPVERSRYACLENLPIAMGYVPYQEEFTNVMELGCALQAGTIFEKLRKPFCGRRGGYR